MFSRCNCVSFLLIMTPLFIGNIGCDSRLTHSDGTSGGSSSAKSSSRGTSNDEVPGPQTEPPLSENTEPTSEPDKRSSAETNISVQVIDRAGFDSALAKHAGKVVLVDYWATWCGPCRKKFPHTVSLAKQHKSSGLAVITVSMDDDEDHEDVLKFLTEQQAAFDNLRSKLGKSDESFESFGIPGGALPCLRLYDRQGQLIKTFAFDPDAEKQFTDGDVAEAVLAALAK